MTATERIIKPLQPVLESLVPAPNSAVAWDTVQLARHQARPHSLDYIQYLCSDFYELRGDRGFADDPALVGGVGRTPLGPVVVLGHQKGCDLQENVRRNFGMAHPEGHRKALRLMRQADKFGMPVICLIDTPGAQPTIEAEARGQAQSIAHNLVAMASLQVPIVAAIIGEGGSGGALAIGLADRLLMLEHAIYSVASPEASASILWRDASKAPEAAAAMKMTALDLLRLGVIDEIVPEATGGAHTDPAATIATAAAAILRHLAQLCCQDREQLRNNRYLRYRSIGSFYAG